MGLDVKLVDLLCEFLDRTLNCDFTDDLANRQGRTRNAGRPSSESQSVSCAAELA